ncbi:MAG: hypothetical protein ABI171_00885 [Collimonas sp.]|uniref:hypothetical protein n=1 Tax=Collimonas sp. TaxID=1963772 RepID=UPI0032658DD9
MSTFLYKRAGAVARATGSWWADWMNNNVHPALGGNDVPGKMGHANLLEPTFSKCKDAISQRGHSHKDGREKSRHCAAERWNKWINDWMGD